MFRLYVITNICFLEVVVKWPGSVHDSRILLRSTVNNMLRTEVILKCEKVVVDGGISVVVCILGYPAYPLLPFVMKEYPIGGKDDREKLFGYKLLSARIVIKNAFRRLKGRLRCLNKAMDVNI